MYNAGKVGKWGIPAGVADIVFTLCADYDRRKACVDRELFSPQVREYYQTLNTTIDTALEVVGEAMRADIFIDIKTCRGYMFSPISAYTAKNTYYKIKRTAIRSIAKSFNLI